MTSHTEQVGCDSRTRLPLHGFWGQVYSREPCMGLSGPGSWELLTHLSASVAGTSGPPPAHLSSAWASGSSTPTSPRHPDHRLWQEPPWALGQHSGRGTWCSPGRTDGPCRLTWEADSLHQACSLKTQPFSFPLGRRSVRHRGPTAGGAPSASQGQRPREGADPAAPGPQSSTEPQTWGQQASMV